MGKPDPYGNWVIGRFRQETAGNPGPLPEEVIAAARVAWPRALAHAAREFGRDGSSRECQALAADIWEAVLRSVSRALQRKGGFASSVADFESYLLAAFHHRFHRFQKIEHARREMFQSVSESLDLGLIEGALDTKWVSELERAITIRQITSRMDGWTRKVWRARQLGYTWKEISSWLGVTEQQAKMKFQYGLEKTRHSIVRVLKAGKPKESK
jgi:hypothetical protein